MTNEIFTQKLKERDRKAQRARPVMWRHLHTNSIYKVINLEIKEEEKNATLTLEDGTHVKDPPIIRYIDYLKKKLPFYIRKGHGDNFDIVW
jgi:hypothetical protein